MPVRMNIDMSVHTSTQHQHVLPRVRRPGCSPFLSKKKAQIDQMHASGLLAALVLRTCRPASSPRARLAGLGPSWPLGPSDILCVPSVRAHIRGIRVFACMSTHMSARSVEHMPAHIPTDNTTAGCTHALPNQGKKKREQRIPRMFSNKSAAHQQ